MTAPGKSPLASPTPWDLVADDYAAELLPQFERYAEDALRLSGVGPGARVLDVACGPGTVALLAAKRAERVDAIDFSPRMVARARARAEAAGVTNVEIAVGDGHALAFPDRAFDAAFSMFGLIFFPERARALAELVRVLRPGGSATISSWLPLDGVPVMGALFGKLAELLPHLGFGNHRAPLGDAGEFQAELEAAGFARVQVERVVHASDAPSLDALWGTLERTMAPLVLLRESLGTERWADVRGQVRGALAAAVGEGPQRVEMPAWIATGRV